MSESILFLEMEENQKRNMLREAQTKLNRTRKNLARLEKIEKQQMKAKFHMTEDEALELKAQS